MASTKSSTKRFMSRYGRRLRQKFGAIEMIQRAKHPCPYCSKVAVKRRCAGIWQCRSCEKTFTGRAYSL